MPKGRLLSRCNIPPWGTFRIDGEALQELASNPGYGPR